MSDQQVDVTVHINDGPPLRGRLTETQQMIDVSTGLPQADRAWEHVDENGHYHAYTHDEVVDHYPTLVSRGEHVECDGSCGGVCGGEGYVITRWFCRICDVEVQPGSVPGPHMATVPGMKDWRVTVYAALPELWNTDRLSVRMVSQLGGYFGVAIATDVQLDSNGWGEAELSGASPLGFRKLAAQERRKAS